MVLLIFRALVVIVCASRVSTSTRVCVCVQEVFDFCLIFGCRFVCVCVSDRVTLPLVSSGRSLIITVYIYLLFVLLFFFRFFFFYYLSATNSTSKGPRVVFTILLVQVVWWCDFHLAADRTRITWETPKCHNRLRIDDVYSCVSRQWRLELKHRD